MNTDTDTRVKTIENATLDDIRPGDHITWSEMWESRGVTTTKKREGIAHRRDADGDWCTEEGAWITDLSGDAVTITIRRTVQELPTEAGAFIEAADEFIEAVVAGHTYRAREAILSAGAWWSAWRTDTGDGGQAFLPECITPGTWKELDK